DVSFQKKIRLALVLDGLHQLRIGRVSQITDLTADGLLPLRQGVDVDVDPWVRVVSRHLVYQSLRVLPHTRTSTSRPIRRGGPEVVANHRPDPRVGGGHGLA